MSKNIFLFSVVIIVFNEDKNISLLFDKLIQLLKNQSAEIIVIDSESTDKTLQIVKSYQNKFKHLRLIEIQRQEFNYGSTRNLGVRLSRGKYICFISGDALPKGKKIFDNFLADFKQGNRVVAVFGKQIPYINTPLIYKIEITCLYNQLDKYVSKNGILIQDIKQPYIDYSGNNKYYWAFLSNVFACYRREFLMSNPFEKWNGAEDVLIGKGIVEKQYIKIYDPRCTIFHSHNFSLYEYFKKHRRNFILRFRKTDLKGKINIVCKLKVILNMHVSVIKKMYYLIQLLFLYYIKLIAIISVLLGI